MATKNTIYKRRFETKKNRFIDLSDSISIFPLARTRFSNKKCKDESVDGKIKICIKQDRSLLQE